jgi:hypothetical protein
MQWAWNLRVSSQEMTSWLTPTTVLLEIMSTAKQQYCATDRVLTFLHQTREGNSRKRVVTVGTFAGLEYSSPTTLVHLLCLSCPGLFLPLVRLLISRNGMQRKRRWELLEQALMQSKESLTQPTFCKVEFEAKASYFKVLACAEMPLCVVVSIVPYRQARRFQRQSSCSSSRHSHILARVTVWRFYSSVSTLKT